MFDLGTVGVQRKPEQTYSGVLKPASDTQTEYLSANKNGKKKNIHIPEYVYEILVYIRTHNNAPKDICRWKNLSQQNVICLRLKLMEVVSDTEEWDVHPKVRGQNRGPERLITSKAKHIIQRSL